MNILRKSILSIVFAGLVLLSCQEKAGTPVNKDDQVSVDAPIPDKSGMTVKGRVINSVTRAPLKGVVVSDGRFCVQTDADGIYYLPTDLETARFVFPVVPSGYEIPANGSSCYGAWKSIPSGKKVHEINFALTPRNGSSDKFRMLFVGDPQLGLGTNSGQQYEKVVLDMAAYKAASDVPVYAVNLGDYPHPNPSVNTSGFDVLKSYIAKSKTTTFSVTGNHDYYPTYNDYDGITNYTKAFGPINYSVNIGKAHFLFLDVIIWDNTSYTRGLDDEALAFLENDLRYVSKDTPLFICTHIVMGKDRSGNYKPCKVNWDQFNNLIAGYNVYGWSGHYHVSHSYSYTQDDFTSGKTKAKSFECNAVVRCTGGTSNNKDEDISSDGIPLGYVVCDVDVREVTWRYHCIDEKYDDAQLLAYTPSMTGDGYVYANVFLWNNKYSDVEWWENGKKVAVMDRSFGIDPMFLKLCKAAGKESAATKDDNFHLFRCKPSSGVKSGEIRVTDNFGNQLVQKVNW